MIKTISFFATVAAVALSVGAYAQPIAENSQLNIAGFAQPENGMVTLDQATGLDFTSGGSPTSGPGVLTGVNGTGTFASFATCTGNCGTITDIMSFSGFTGQANEYVTTSGVSFDLNAPLTVTRIAGSATTLPTLIVSGSGMFHLANYEDTEGVFTLTSQGGYMTTFSASTVASAGGSSGGKQVIPEPMSLALLGTSLAGLGLLRFRRS